MTYYPLLLRANPPNIMEWQTKNLFDTTKFQACKDAAEDCLLKKYMLIYHSTPNLFEI